MDELVDYYATLGLTPAATPEEIKHAYRLRAKAVHPDSGGSAQAMEQVNEAYRVLSDAPSRREYDILRTRPAHAEGESPTVRSAYIAETDHLRGVLHHRMRRAQARRLAWGLIRASGLIAGLLAVLGHFLAPLLVQPHQKDLLGLVVFIPIYSLALGFVFLINPDLRLHIHDLFTSRPNPLSRYEIAGLVAIALAFVPLAALWVFIYAALSRLLP